MSFDLKISLTPESRELLARWPTLAPRALQKMAVALDLENQLTIRYANKNKMSGPRPQFLGRITSRLAASVNAPEPTVDGDQIHSSIGSNVVYAGVHEFGFDGEVQVKAHTRRRVIARVGKRNKVKKFSVGSYTRHMRMPERSFIRSSISERLPNYNASLSQAVVDVLGGKP